jgi:hypothetical protein
MDFFAENSLIWLRMTEEPYRRRIALSVLKNTDFCGMSGVISSNGGRNRTPDPLIED